MSTEQSSKNLGMGSIYIAITAGCNIAVALRRTLTAIKYANIKYGEEHYQDYLKQRGHRFKKDINLARVAMDVKKSDIERMCVNETDVRIIKEYATKYGLDFALTSKPDDLEKLAERKFVKGEELNSQEEKILKAFTIRDEKGKKIMDPENPKMPLLNEAEYMLTIATVDLTRWELICREMEARSHIPSFDDRLKNAVQMAKVNSVHLKTKVKEMFRERMGDRVK